MPEQVTEQCPYCPHTETGSSWWVGQQMPLHVHYAHPEHREINESDSWCDRCDKPCPWEDLATEDDGDTWLCPTCAQAVSHA